MTDTGPTPEDIERFMNAASDLWEDSHFTQGTEAGLAAIYPAIAERVARETRLADAEEARHRFPNIFTVSRWLRERAGGEPS